MSLVHLLEGKNQKTFHTTKEIDIVQRITGGRALLHDDEITYSCIFQIKTIPNGESVTESYKYISQILIDFFKELNIELNFGTHKAINMKHDYCMLLATGADVCYQSKKLIGSAQCRKQGYILQHGSILCGYNKVLLEELFNEKVEGITSLQEILPNYNKEEIIDRLENYILSL